MTDRFSVARGRMRALAVGVAVLAVGFALVASSVVASRRADASDASTAARTATSAVHWRSKLYEMRTPGNTGYFYTASVTEMQRATRLGFRATGANVGYVANRVVAGSVPVYRARLKSRSSYLLTLSVTELRKLVASGRWVYEGVAGRSSKYAGSNKFRIWRVSRSGVGWRVANSSQLPGLKRAGWHLDGPLGYVWKTTI